MNNNNNNDNNDNNNVRIHPEVTQSSWLVVKIQKLTISVSVYFLVFLFFIFCGRLQLMLYVNCMSRIVFFMCIAL